MTTTLKISEIFYSIQGESSFAGQPCVFIRLSGCNLRCAWCDTTYAYPQGTEKSIPEILEQIEKYPCQLVEVTGGEPMFQGDATCMLMSELLRKNKQVLLETNGSLILDKVPQGVHRIIDLKPPRSHVRHDEDLWMHYSTSWRDTDEIKCVVADRDDFDWCLEKLQKYQALHHIVVHFSPVWDKLKPDILAEWICQCGQPVRLNLQIQKVIWDPNARGV